MKRVLFIIGNMGLGGAETQIMKLYRCIDKTKLQFDFCVNVAEENYYENEICQLGGNMFRTIPKIQNPFMYHTQIYKIIKRNKYKAVVKCTESSAAWSEMFVSLIAGSKIRAVRSTNTHISNNKIRLFMHFLGRPLLRLFTTIMVAPSEDSWTALFGNKTKKMIILPNGTDINSFKFDSYTRYKTRKEFKLENKIVIGTIGRMSVQKNQLFLLDLFALFKKSHPNAVLMIVGSGDCYSQILNKANELCITNSLILTGNRNDVSQLLMAMDLFCLPSLYEGMPNCVIEAQTTGLPCLVSNTVTSECNVISIVNFAQLNNLDDWIIKLSKMKCNDDVFRASCADKMMLAGYDSLYIASKIEAFFLMYA